MAMQNSIDQIVKQKPYKPYIIFDIDGTLADDTHRLHHISQGVNGEKISSLQWAKYYHAMMYDKLILPVATIYHRLCDNKRERNHKAIFITGRPEPYRRMTEDWLMQYKIMPDYLFMRPEKDHCSSVDFKRRIMQNYVKQAPVLFIIEDRSCLVKMFRSMGYKTLQCAEGDY